MNKSIEELQEYLRVFTGEYSCLVGVDVFISPVTAGLGVAAGPIKDSCVELGAQNMHFEDAGAYTGEVSPRMLSQLGCTYVLIGHSERRWYFGETNEIINKKMKAAIANHIRPILCVGESLKTKELGLTKEYIKIQLFEWLEWVNFADIDIAYEPIWAIGTGQSATSEYVSEIHDYIRTFCQNDSTRIIYGGSVTEANAGDYMSKQNIDGLLVGGASLDPNRFIKIIEEWMWAKSKFSTL